MGQGEQQLTRAFAKFADLLAELFCYLHDLLANVGFARFAKLVFVVALNQHRRQNRDQHENDQPNRQTDVRQAGKSKSAFDGDTLVQRWAGSLHAH